MKKVHWKEPITELLGYSRFTKHTYKEWQADLLIQQCQREWRNEYKRERRRYLYKKRKDRLQNVVKTRLKPG